MAFLFHKFQEAVKTLAKNPMFAKDPRQLQFEADINRLFLYTSYKRLGHDAVEEDADEIIEMAGKASVADQQQQVQDNIHHQIKSFCSYMDEILLCDINKMGDELESSSQSSSPRRSGLSFAIGESSSNPHVAQSALPRTRPFNLTETSVRLKDLMGYALNVRPSKISHKDAGRGLFIDGEADIGSVVGIYPGVVYSPAYYRYIPGYPRVDYQNRYLITRFDGTVINGQPWGAGGDARELWDGSNMPEIKPNAEVTESGSDRFWKLLSKPLNGTPANRAGDILERRNPLALAHFANHPEKGMDPNVMICPYDFPLTEKNMRAYIPNVIFGNAEVTMKRFGSFWFKSGTSKDNATNTPILKSLVLVATRALHDEELLLNYRLSNTKRRPEWYTPVDEEEDRRRWS